MEPNKPLKEWRDHERIFPDSYRMLPFENETVLSEKTVFFSKLVRMVQNDFIGLVLDKRFHHPEYIDRSIPKILSIKIFTIGNGWKVEYNFDFKEHNYEGGWSYSYSQMENESLWDFFIRVYDELSKITINPSELPLA